jgi:hypothetical protein
MNLGGGGAQQPLVVRPCVLLVVRWRIVRARLRLRGCVAFVRQALFKRFHFITHAHNHNNAVRRCTVPKPGY